jgi:polyisoprenoid-binding protein YceI
MKQFFFSSLVLSCLFVTPLRAEESAKQWYLPQTLSDSNTKVSFEVDSTWHLVEGTTSHITGEASLLDPENPQSVIVELTLPVAHFDTDNSLRDSKMRRVMSAEQYPLVTFKSSQLLEGCSPEVVQQKKTCETTLEGALTILAVTQEISLPVSISYEKDKSYRITGMILLTWGEFGVEDPSILIASVDPTVEVSFTVHLSPRKTDRSLMKTE